MCVDRVGGWNGKHFLTNPSSRVPLTPRREFGGLENVGKHSYSFAFVFPLWRLIRGETRCGRCKYGTRYWLLRDLRFLVGRFSTGLVKWESSDLGRRPHSPGRTRARNRALAHQSTFLYKTQDGGAKSWKVADLFRYCSSCYSWHIAGRRRCGRWNGPCSRWRWPKPMARSVTSWWSPDRRHRIRRGRRCFRSPLRKRQNHRLRCCRDRAVVVSSQSTTCFLRNVDDGRCWCRVQVTYHQLVGGP